MSRIELIDQGQAKASVLDETHSTWVPLEAKLTLLDSLPKKIRRSDVMH